MTENKIDALIKRVFHATGISSQSDLAKELDETSFNTNNKLLDLFEMGYVGRYYSSNFYTYFIEK